jgi:hypothetical protein
VIAKKAGKPAEDVVIAVSMGGGGAVYANLFTVWNFHFCFGARAAYGDPHADAVRAVDT